MDQKTAIREVTKPLIPGSVVDAMSESDNKFGDAVELEGRLKEGYVPTPMDKIYKSISHIIMKGFGLGVEAVTYWGCALGVYETIASGRIVSGPALILSSIGVRELAYHMSKHQSKKSEVDIDSITSKHQYLREFTT